jgi:hypothetical protein
VRAAQARLSRPWPGRTASCQLRPETEAEEGEERAWDRAIAKSDFRCASGECDGDRLGQSELSSWAQLDRGGVSETVTRIELRL